MDVIVADYVVGHLRSSLRPGAIPRPGVGEVVPTVFVMDGDVSVRHASSRSSERQGAGQELRLGRRLPGSLSRLRPGLRDPGPDASRVERARSPEAGCRRPHLPIIFVTGHTDVSMAVEVEAMKAGAVEVLTKPIGGIALLRAIETAIERRRAVLRHDSAMRMLRNRYATLTRREREVMALVVSGLLNKQVGGELGINELTVKAHRGQVMRKMVADSLPELVIMAMRLGLLSVATH